MASPSSRARRVVDTNAPSAGPGRAPGAPADRPQAQAQHDAAGAGAPMMSTPMATSTATNALLAFIESPALGDLLLSFILGSLAEEGQLSRPVDEVNQQTRGKVLSRASAKALQWVRGGRMVEVKTEAEAEVDGQVFPLVKPEIKEDVKEEVLAGATCLNLQLRITHDCRSSGCGDLACLVCRNNPSRACPYDLKDKYIMGTPLVSPCDAPVRVELVDGSTGTCVPQGLPPGWQLQVHVLDGQRYEQLSQSGAARLSTEQLRSCMVLRDNGCMPLRMGDKGKELQQCVLQLAGAQASLSCLQVSASSEALLKHVKSRAPTLRLLLWAVDGQGEPAPQAVGYVVTQAFTSTTPRVKNSQKPRFPCVGDDLSKLHGMGRKAVENLANFKDHYNKARKGCIDLLEELYHITTVEGFQRLLAWSGLEKDTLRGLLCMSAELWAKAEAHAAAAVQPDSTPCCFICPQEQAGLVYACSQGAPLLAQPTHLIPQSDSCSTVLPIDGLGPAQFGLMRRLHETARHTWAQPGHPGWSKWNPGAAPAGSGAGTAAGAGARQERRQSSGDEEEGELEQESRVEVRGQQPSKQQRKQVQQNQHQHHQHKHQQHQHQQPQQDQHQQCAGEQQPMQGATLLAKQHASGPATRKRGRSSGGELVGGSKSSAQQQGAGQAAQGQGQQRQQVGMQQQAKRQSICSMHTPSPEVAQSFSALQAPFTHAAAAQPPCHAHAFGIVTTSAPSCSKQPGPSCQPAFGRSTSCNNPALAGKHLHMASPNDAAGLLAGAHAVCANPCPANTHFPVVETCAANMPWLPQPAAPPHVGPSNAQALDISMAGPSGKQGNDLDGEEILFPGGMYVDGCPKVCNGAATPPLKHWVEQDCQLPVPSYDQLMMVDEDADFIEALCSEDAWGL